MKEAKMNLTRQQEILKLIVEDFIANGDPVGSNSLIKSHNLQYSSATVRNDMVKLESSGYIEKTHTSSGRVPSSKGYRYYVENLKKEKNLSVDEEFKREFQIILRKKSQSIEDVMDESCEILSQLSNNATVMLGPDANKENLVSVSMVLISPTAATAIFVTDRGYVENKTFVIRTEEEMKQVKECVEFLNKRLVGTNVGEIVFKIEALKPILSDVLGKSSNIIMDSFIEAFVKFANERINSHGAMKLLGNPEYGEDKEKLKTVLDLIQSPDKLRTFIEAGDQGFVQDEKDDVTILSHELNINGKASGKIAVVGPQRMDYRKLIGALDYIAKELSSYYKLEEDDEEKEDNKEEDDE